MIPLDKSWIIRLGVLDVLNGRKRIFEIDRDSAGTDVTSLIRAGMDWQKNTVYVGESGTLYRFLQFASWARGLNKKFVKRGTLKDREICSDPSIVDMKPEELLKLDGGTSQWASAKYICHQGSKVDNPPLKLQLTYDAYDHWCDNEKWEPRRDQTIQRQFEAFMSLIESGSCDFSPEHSEDYCFARAFDLIDAREGESRWPSLRRHESDRIAEMEDALDKSDRFKTINSKDHRVIQAIAMKQTVNRRSCSNIANPQDAFKSWPQFWCALNTL